MQELEFEWDERKSDQIFEERGFDFGFAVQAFLDPNAIHRPDDRRGGSSSSSKQRGLSAPASSQPGKPTVARFRITPNGALLKQTHSRTWVQTIPRVDLERLDATTDTDINHQRIAELVDEALRASTSSVAQLAKSLHLSPTTIRRWRRGTASPTAANLLKLQNQISA